MPKNISINKHEYNQRRVIELNKEILKLENKLKETKGFINILKLKLKLKKLYKTINIHGEETLEYEIKNNSH